MKAGQQFVMAAGMALALGARAAVTITNYWDHVASGDWGDTHTNGAATSVPGWSDVTGDGLGDVAATDYGTGVNSAIRLTGPAPGMAVLFR